MNTSSSAQKLAKPGTPMPHKPAIMNIDPAIAGGVVLTTVTDVVGYIACLGLGAIYLL